METLQEREERIAKACGKCGKAKPLDDFHADRNKPQGRAAWCKPCTSAYFREYRQRNQEKRLAQKRDWYAANRERHAANGRAWAADNRDKINTDQRAAYAANREPKLAQNREWYRANRERRLAVGKAWREANPERARAISRAWEKANPSKIRAKAHKRRAAQLRAPYDDVDVAVVFVRDDGICGICGEAVDQANWHLDHVIPLSRGGHHTYSNVQVSHPVCNMSKGARLPSEMRDRGNRSRA